MRKDNYVPQPILRQSKYYLRPSKYSRVIAIDEVRTAKKELLQKIVSHDNSDNYIGYILQRNRVNANNKRLKTIGNYPLPHRSSQPTQLDSL